VTNCNLYRRVLYPNVLYPLYHLVKRDGVNEAIKDLKKNQWMNKEEIDNLQHQKLLHLLRFAYKNVPYYHDVIPVTQLSVEQLALPDNFCRIPILTKQSIRKNIERLIATDLKGNKLEKNSTSGSTGEPLFFYTDLWSSTYRKATVIRNKGWAGFRLGDREARLWGSPIDESRVRKLRGRMHGIVTNQLFLSAYDLTPECIDEYIELIHNFRPTLMVAYPSILEAFAAHCRTRQASFDCFKAIISSAETLYPHQREFFEAEFGVRVFNRYGCREVGDIAQECEVHNGLHVNSDRILVEILDNQGMPCEPGRWGELFVTDLDNYGMPFIRYQIGDSAVWAEDQKCPCGRGLPLLAEVEGRSMDVVRSPSGNSLGGTFWTILFRMKPGIKQIQIVQEKLDGVKVMFVRDVGFEECVLDYFRDRIKEKCGTNFVVEFNEVSSIRNTKSGKNRLVISKCSYNSQR
jgi:phenylacetate-CoA ligase